MDHFHIDLALDYGDEEFNFESQLSSASSARSFSTASSCAPITPQSGRSTPQQHSTSMTFSNHSIGYELTPPIASMEDYFSSDIKPEFADCEDRSTTTSRKSSIAAPSMELDHANIFNTALPTYGNNMEFTNPQALEQYHFSEHLTSSPFALPPPPYSLLNPTGCETSSLWAFSSGNSLGFLDRNPSPILPSTTQAPLPPPYLPSHSRRHLRMDDVRQKSDVLHRVQGGSRVKRDRAGMLDPHIQTVGSGAFKCEFAECAGKKAYKRQEHLKRHISSCHDKSFSVSCEFCGHEFNRRDNWRQHIKLHTKPRRPGIARTAFYPGAQAAVEEELKRTKHRNPSKKKSSMKDRHVLDALEHFGI